MLIVIALTLILVVFVMIAFLSILGRKLELFSSDKLKQSKSLRFAPIRWLLFSVIGFVWILAKIHFPGIEVSVTYGFDNKLGHAMRAAYWKCRVNKLGKDVIIDIGAKAIGWRNISIDDNSWIDRNVILETGLIDKTKFNVHIKKTSSLVNEGELKIGKGCHISKNAIIQANGGVMIGDYSGIAAGGMIYSLSQHYKNVKLDDGRIYKFTPLAPAEDQSLIQGPVILEGNNALGLNSVILPGVTIGKNSWVGVYSYVVNDIPPDSLAAGCPAKVIKVFSHNSTPNPDNH